MKVELVILFVLGVSWVCDSRELGIAKRFAEATDSKDSVLRVNHMDSIWAIRSFKEVGEKDHVCTLCENYAAEAQSYFAANKTQKEILYILHKSCSKMLSFKKECITLVDYYVPLFFLEISSVQPGEFCQKLNLCDQVVSISQHLMKDSCEFCQHAVAEALLKLKDPDTQLEILEMLLKECKSVKGYEKQCKRMVFEYGPIILANAEHLLEANDICTMLHACESSKANIKQAFTGEKDMVATS